MAGTWKRSPRGVIFLLENRDRPGIVGHVGTLLGKHKVNIAGMSLSRDEAGGEALTVLNLDSVPGRGAHQGTHRRGRHSHRAGRPTLIRENHRRFRSSGQACRHRPFRPPGRAGQGHPGSLGGRIFRQGECAFLRAARARAARRLGRARQDRLGDLSFRGGVRRRPFSRRSASIIWPCGSMNGRNSPALPSREPCSRTINSSVFKSKKTAVLAGLSVQVLAGGRRGGEA